jgi:hypothetical protein
MGRRFTCQVQRAGRLQSGDQRAGWSFPSGPTLCSLSLLHLDGKSDRFVTLPQ